MSPVVFSLGTRMPLGVGYAMQEEACYLSEPHTRSLQVQGSPVAFPMIRDQVLRGHSGATWPPTAHRARGAKGLENLPPTSSVLELPPGEAGMGRDQDTRNVPELHYLLEAGHDTEGSEGPVTSDTLCVPAEQLGGAQSSGRCECVISESRQAFPSPEHCCLPKQDDHCPFSTDEAAEAQTGEMESFSSPRSEPHALPSMFPQVLGLRGWPSRCGSSALWDVAGLGAGKSCCPQEVGRAGRSSRSPQLILCAWRHISVLPMGVSVPPSHLCTKHHSFASCSHFTPLLRELHLQFSPVDERCYLWPKRDVWEARGVLSSWLFPCWELQLAA